MESPIGSKTSFFVKKGNFAKGFKYINTHPVEASS